MKGKNRVLVTGLGSILSVELDRELSLARPNVVGIASAFVSLAGFQEALQMTARAGRPKCRLIAGVSHAVTHPEALYAAVNAGWEVKLGVKHEGIFHPKLVVGGLEFDSHGQVVSPSFVYIGSGNLTHAGLRNNIECGILSYGEACPKDAAGAFGELWRQGTIACKSNLDRYEQVFAQKNRNRPIEDLLALGIFDSEQTRTEDYSQIKQSRNPQQRAVMSSRVARAAWTGLESFTGEYRFQVEFPRTAGEVLRDMIIDRANHIGSVRIYCVDLGVVLQMQYRYYSDNSMFRLNIPNDLTGVAKARKLHQGIALITATKRRDAVVQLQILPRGVAMQEIVSRSVALGTWGRTSTRAYGWF